MLKKTFLYLALSLLGANIAIAQAALLEKFSTKMQATKTFSTRFVYLSQSNATDARVDQRGELLISEKKYRLDLGNMVIFFDGTARYTYLKAENEVTVTTPNVLQDGIFSDPSAIFFIDGKDFFVKQTGEGKLRNRPMVNLELTPKQKEMPYSKIALGIDKEQYTPLQITYHGSDNSVVSIAVDEFNTSVKPTPADFSFDAKKYPQVEIIDMR